MSNTTIECTRTPAFTGEVADARPNTLLTPDFLSVKEYPSVHGSGNDFGAPMNKRILLAPRPLSRRG